MAEIFNLPFILNTDNKQLTELHQEMVKKCITNYFTLSFI